MAVYQSVPFIESVTLSTLCSRCIGQILVRIQSGETLESEDLVHQTRVLTKRLRAAWKLAREVASADLVRDRRGQLRELSGHLSGSRDQAVLRRLCLDLAGDSPDKSEVAFRNLETTIRASGVTGAEITFSIEELAARLEEERGAWESLDWGSARDGELAIQKRFEKSMKVARETTRNALRTDCPEEWHEWRKAVKELRYQGEFLTELETRRRTDFEIKVKKLGTLLGKRNDLANLSAFSTAQKALSKKERESIKAKIEVDSDKIMLKCRSLARDLFEN